MASEYKSNPVRVSAPVERVYTRFSNLENLKALINNAPADRLSEEQLAQLQGMEITSDTLTMSGGPTGSITLRVSERREPELVALRPDNLPMDLNLELRFKGIDGQTTDIEAAIVADIPMMLRPMVKGPFQKIVDQFASMVGAIPFE